MNKHTEMKEYVLHSEDLWEIVVLALNGVAVGTAGAKIPAFCTEFRSGSNGNGPRLRIDENSRKNMYIPPLFGSRAGVILKV